MLLAVLWINVGPRAMIGHCATCLGYCATCLWDCTTCLWHCTTCLRHCATYLGLFTTYLTLGNTPRTLRNTPRTLRNICFLLSFNIYRQLQRSMAKMHWPPMNKFACKLHGYIVYFIHYDLLVYYYLSWFLLLLLFFLLLNLLLSYRKKNCNVTPSPQSSTKI